MNWSYRFTPDMEYGKEMIPRKENNSTGPKFDNHIRKDSSQNFGFMELFSVVMVIPISIFIYKFFYLLVLPLVPISVVVFELVREVAPLNKLLMFGSSFLAAYLFYRGMKKFLSSFSLGWWIFMLFVFYIFAMGMVYFLIDYYPNNDALQGVVLEIKYIV